MASTLDASRGGSVAFLPARVERSTAGIANWRRTALWRRALLFVLVMTQTAIGSYFFAAVLPYHGRTGVEIGLITAFAVLFAWMATGFWTAVFGFVLQCRGGDRHSLLRRHAAEALDAAPAARTAVVMPLYHEPVERSLAGLRAMYESLARLGYIEQFDFYILSDSRDPEVWLAEQAAWHALCRELGASGRIHYRRRSVHLRHKSGNIADFLRRWGAGYAYFMVLDADSVVAAETLVRMVNLMEREPQIGILQTAPSIVRARSTFARVHQFASRAYGGLFATGLAALQLGEAAYWGHNALIRTAPFMRLCGLRNLPGFGLFRGAISSHDFVEAAYMARGGYEVWLEPGLSGSYEEYPPTLIDDLARDRRWTKGNLQHLWLLVRAPRLRAAHRLVFFYGIMAYFASPLWLLFLILSAVEVMRFTLWPINYFPEDYSLFPIWPHWHPHWAIGLASSVMVLLFLPKLLAVIDLIRRGEARGFGGTRKLVHSALLESLVSVLLAPVRMLKHTRFVIEALANSSLRWAGQNRSEETEWRPALLHHAPATVLALAWAGFALWLKPLYFFWSLPITLALIASVPVSVLLSRVSLGDALRRRRLTLIPEERRQPRILSRLEELEASAPRLERNFEQAIIDPRLNALHVALARRRAAATHTDQVRLRRRCLQDGPRRLTTAERARLARDAESLSWLHQAVWRAAPDSPWGRLLEEQHRRRDLWQIGVSTADARRRPGRIRTATLV